MPPSSAEKGKVEAAGKRLPGATARAPTEDLAPWLPRAGGNAATAGGQQQQAGTSGTGGGWHAGPPPPPRYLRRLSAEDAEAPDPLVWPLRSNSDAGAAAQQLEPLQPTGPGVPMAGAVREGTLVTSHMVNVDSDLSDVSSSSPRPRSGSAKARSAPAAAAPPDPSCTFQGSRLAAQPAGGRTWQHVAAGHAAG